MEKPSVLVVDDRPENLLSVEAILAPLDVVIYKAASASAALRCMLDVDFAVVLLDVEMPDIDGYETARLIRSRKKTREVPIIFLTANDSGYASAQKGYELGAVDFLVKPIQPEILRWKVSVFAELSRKASQERQLLKEQIARAESEALARRAELLSKASAALASSLQEDVMLSRLVDLLTPGFADFAAVYRVCQSRELRMGPFAHRHGGAYPATHRMHAHVVPLSNRESLLVRALEGPGDLTMIDAAERSASKEMMDQVHADFFTSLGLRFGLFLPIRGNTGPIGVLGLYRMRKPYSRSDHSVADDLANRIALSVANAQLYAASQQASLAKDQFLAVVSHELRTPLTAILGWVHVLLAKSLPPNEMERALKTIQRNAKLQSDLIGDILDISRFATGQFSVTLEDVEIRALLEQCIETLRPVAGEKKIALKYDCTAAPQLVAGDPTRLQQVFSNLLSNAIKFTPEGGVVAVKFSATPEQAEILVADTGVGIKKEFLAHVFDPFIQADSSNTRSHSGLGLGLAIVRHLVEIHGGVISAASDGPGKGAVFTVLLPLRNRKALAS